MRVRSTPAHLLLRIAFEQDRSQQAASFRQALVTLAQAAGGLGPPALDGVDPVALESAVHVVIERGFVDHIDFLSEGEAAVALYEISSALPSGSVKRDLRRRVFAKIYNGSAATFTAVASRIALGAAAPLLAPTLRARVALCLELPLDAELNLAPLALALTTRSATHSDWIARPSTRALASRRLAALLYEHAAREAVFRFQLGDPQPRDLLLSPRWGSDLQRLLLDREPLVWQHAAVARGLLAAIHPEVRQEVELALDPNLTPTQWRRAGVSLVTSCALGDEEAHQSVIGVLQGSLCENDRGLVAAMVAGLGRVIEFDPDIAENLANHFAAEPSSEVAVAFAQLLSRTRDPSFAVNARRVLRDTLIEDGKRQSRIERSLAARSLQLLEETESVEQDLPRRLKKALQLFETSSAQEAYQEALAAFHEASEIASFVESNAPSDEHALAPAIAALSEFDSGVLETGTLNNLLLLGRAPGDSAELVEPVERLQNRVSRWILDGVEKTGEAAWSRDLAIADQRRLRVLLHLVDVEATGRMEDRSRHPIANRLMRSIRVLLARIAENPDAMVHRVLCAALARSFDAAVREEIVQASDLLLTVASTLADSYSVRFIGEASTTSDVAEPLLALAAFMDVDSVADFETDSSSALTIDPNVVAEASMAESLRKIGRLMSLSKGLLGGGGYHAEALRRVFFRMGRALERVAVARSQAELVQSRDTGAPILQDLSVSCEELAHMVRCAERRVLGAARSAPHEHEEDGLYEVVERGVESDSAPELDDIARAVDEVVYALPEAIAQAIEQVVYRIQGLPLAADSDTFAVPLASRRALLPAWLLPRRSIGSFHVVRPLGAGGVSSVFLARRLEERNNPHAESFALKVPEYDPSTARSMTEAEFFQLFRDEAGALLSLPSHDNLARFVTFDLSARPKPILVMELISGTPLDRLIRSRALTMPKVIAQLDGILAGLEAMHAVQVGHLDVKASNVILRPGGTPVLVDFGLSGRTLRPGCGTIEYTSPEVLGVVPDGLTPSPIAADIYSFGCLMYEVLTGDVLFDAPDEVALVTKHISHDGWLAELQTMASMPGLDRIANLIGSCLRHDPRNRPSAAQLRNELTRALLPLTEHSWPLVVPRHAATG